MEAAYVVWTMKPQVDSITSDYLKYLAEVQDVVEYNTTLDYITNQYNSILEQTMKLEFNAELANTLLLGNFRSHEYKIDDFNSEIFFRPETYNGILLHIKEIINRIVIARIKLHWVEYEIKMYKLWRTIVLL